MGKLKFDPSPGDSSRGIGEVFRIEWPRLVATLTGRYRDLNLAEEAASEAVLEAVSAWGEGLPANPGGWLMTTANRKAIDRLRRESRRDAKYAEAVVGASVPEPTHRVEDDQLRLIFMCCHRALAPEVRLALTLRMVSGLTVEEIARGLLVSEAAIGQRITRAKTKIRGAKIPFAVPENLEERLADVLAVIYVVFNEGYLPGGASELRVDLSDEAIRLSRLVHALMPGELEAQGLLALVLLTDARRAARVDEAGELVTLDAQDRSLWNAAQLAEGHALVRACVASNRPGPYQLQAAINAVHTSAPHFQLTDWAALYTLYDQLYALQPQPIVALNRAVVTAELRGPEVSLAEIDDLPLSNYHAFHAARAELLRRVGRIDEARAAYTRAIELASNVAEVRHLTRRLGDLGVDA